MYVFLKLEAQIIVCHQESVTLAVLNNTGSLNNNFSHVGFVSIMLTINKWVKCCHAAAT